MKSINKVFWELLLLAQTVFAHGPDPDRLQDVPIPPVPGLLDGADPIIKDKAMAIALARLGSRYFAKAFMGIPAQQAAKLRDRFMPSAAPASCFTRCIPTRGMQHRYRNDSTRCRKACIFTTQKTLRENTCPIVLGTTRLLSRSACVG